MRDNYVEDIFELLQYVTNKTFQVFEIENKWFFLDNKLNVREVQDGDAEAPISTEVTIQKILNGELQVVRVYSPDTIKTILYWRDVRWYSYITRDNYDRIKVFKVKPKLMEDRVFSPDFLEPEGGEQTIPYFETIDEICPKGHCVDMNKIKIKE